MIDLACARSVIVDEGLSKAAKAIEIVDVAIEEYGRDPALIRQKSKVLGHYDRDMEAADLLISIEDEVSLESPFDRALALRDGGTSAARADRFADAARLFGKAHDVLSGIEAHRALAAGLLADKALAQWSGGDRASALTSIADALDEVGNIDPSASRQNERAHHFARAVGGLFFHDLDAYPLGPRPIIAFGGASALSLDKEPLINVDLKPLSDNWRILALVEIETGCEVGIEQRSLAKQTEPGIASIELMICCARYGRTLTQGTIDETIQAGIAATSAAKATLAHPQPMARIELAELVGTPAEAMLSDANWRDAIFRIPVDILLWQKLQGGGSPEIVDSLAQACATAFGGHQVVETFFKAASGRYAVGPDAPLSFLTVAAIARLQENLAGNPRSRFQRDLILVVHVSQSLARRVLEPLVVSTIVRGWTSVLESERFALRAPVKNCPAIEESIASMEKDGIRGAARLILAAAPAVAFELGANWEELLKRVAR